MLFCSWCRYAYVRIVVIPATCVAACLPSVHGCRYMDCVNWGPGRKKKRDDTELRTRIVVEAMLALVFGFVSREHQQKFCLTNLARHFVGKVSFQRYTHPFLSHIQIVNRNKVSTPQTKVLYVVCDIQLSDFLCPTAVASSSLPCPSVNTKRPINQKRTRAARARCVIYCST